jgi:hypothetical protein
MSKPREANPELARILSRVNALMKHELESPINHEPPMHEPAGQKQVEQADTNLVPEDEVPVLTEVYEGEVPALAPRTIDDFAAITVDPSAHEPDDAALEAIVAELMPLIRAEVKKAVRKELINMEKIVNHQLETEFLQTLMQRLRSEQSD